MAEETERVNRENCTRVLEMLRKNASKRDEKEIKSRSSRSSHGCLLLLVRISVFVKGKPAVDADKCLVKSLCRCATTKASSKYLLESHTENY